MNLKLVTGMPGQPSDATPRNEGDDEYTRRLTCAETTAHPARVYDYLLGGKDNFEPDRDAAEAMLTHVPDGRAMVRANREFLIRAVRVLAGDLGIRQFLDIGSGLPTQQNVHEVAQTIDPAASVLYVDKDAVVGAHARALLTPVTDLGMTGFLMADATDPVSILAEIGSGSDLGATIDLTQPVGLMVVSMLMYFDDTTAHHVVRTLVDALPSGSYLTISHPTADFDPAAVAKAVAAGEKAGLTYIPRTLAQVEALFRGLDLVEPGVVPLPSWRPDRPPVEVESGSAADRMADREAAATGAHLRSVYFYGGMARIR